MTNNYIELDLSQLENKIRYFPVAETFNVKIRNDFFLLNFLEIQDGVIYLLDKNKDLLARIPPDARGICTDRVIVNVHFRGLDYFFKGVLESCEYKTSIEQTSDEHCYFKIFSIEKIFRIEKRQEERVLTYPHQRAYLYIEMPSFIETSENNGSRESSIDGVNNNVEKNNVLFFNRQKKSDDQVFIQYAKKRRLKIHNTHYLKYRILDISPVGVSFIIHRSEEIVLRDKNQLSDFIIKIDNEEVRIFKATILYVIDYLDSSFENIKMSKVGLQLHEKSIVLEKLLTDITPVNSTENDLDEFEEFLISKK